MRIFVLHEGSYEDRHVVGIFSSREAVLLYLSSVAYPAYLEWRSQYTEEDIRRYNLERRPYTFEKWLKWNEDIEEFELDSPGRILT